MSTLELRPMGIGDILDGTFRLYRQNFLTFLVIALVVYVPYALLMSLFHLAGAPIEPGPTPTSPPVFHPLAMVLAIIPALLFVFILLPLCNAALIHNISASYLGENVSASGSYSRAAPRLVPLLWTQFLAGVIVMIGLILFIVPGIIFSFWFFVLAPIIILEGVSGTTALGRSRDLMRGNIGKAFLLGLAVGLLVWVIGFALGLAGGMVARMLPWPDIFLTFFNSAVQALLLPIQAASIILFYYDLRIRKEAFDLQKLSEAISQPAAPATA